jgi:hypothetical protein
MLGLPAEYQLSVTQARARLRLREAQRLLERAGVDGEAVARARRALQQRRHAKGVPLVHERGHRAAMAGYYLAG